MSYWKTSIKDKDALSLKKALKIREFLYSIKDYAFLCDDLASFEKNGFLMGELEEKKAFRKKLGNFVSPDFEILGHGENVDYRKSLNAGENEELEIFCGAFSAWKFNFDGISFSILKQGLDNPVFFEGPFPNYARDRFPYTSYKIVLEMANYFFSRQLLYMEIYKNLFVNKDELKESTNEEFSNDLISLFSVENFSLKVPSFSINRSNTRQINLEEYLKNIKTGEKIGYIDFYLGKGEGKNEICFQSRINATLNNNNELFFGLEKIRHDKPQTDCIFVNVRDVINSKTSDFLKDIVTSTYFGNAIFGKIKTKFFVKNIL